MTVNANVQYKTRAQLEDSPSRRDGYSPKEEARQRRGYVALIQDVGMKLKVPQWAISTAVLFCHRYFAVRSLKSNDHFLIAAACLHLACKVEEAPRQLRVVAESFYKVKYGQAAVMTQEASDELRDQVLVAERALLYTLGFALNVPHPYKFLLKTVKELGILDARTDSPHKELMQISWNFLNDSMRTTLCLQYRPEWIAGAALFLASQLKQVPLPLREGHTIYSIFDITNDALQDICNQILELYEEAQQAYPPGALPGSKVAAQGQQQQQQQQPPQEQQQQPTEQKPTHLRLVQGPGGLSVVRQPLSAPLTAGGGARPYGAAPVKQELKQEAKQEAGLMMGGLGAGVVSRPGS